MVNDEIPQGAVRKEVYAWLKAEGFDLTEKRHKVLKAFFVRLMESKKIIREQAPVEHRIVCTSCGGSRVEVGKLSKALKKAVKEAMATPGVVFMECDTDRAKAGSPELCRGCVHNRDVIGRLSS